MPYTLPKELIREGAWYQPYIHSNPKNFSQTRKAFYSNFTLKDTYDKTMSAVRSMMTEVISFYTNKEEKFRKATGLSRQDFYANIGEIIINAEQNYKNNNITGLKDIDSMMEALKGPQSVKDEYLNSRNTSQLVMNYVEGFFDPNNKENKKIKDDLEKPNASIKRFKKDTLITVTFVADYIKGILGEDVPDNILNIILEHVITGKPLDPGLDKRTKEAIKKMKAITDEEWSFIRSFVKRQKPIVDSGSLRQTAKSKNSKSRASEVSRDFGATLNEVSIVRLISSSISTGMVSVIQELQSKLTGTQTTQQKRLSVVDGILTVQFTNSTGKDFELGLDIKYSANADKLGPKYTRGFSQEKDVKTLETLFVAGHLNEITYLLTNLYYHNSDDAAYKAYYRQILTVVQLVSGLLTLLPAGKSFGNFDNPKMVGNTLRRDKRMFVVINAKLYLMTTFLWGVFDSLFSGRSWKNENASLKLLQNSLEAILSTIGTGTFTATNSDVIQGPIYEAKRPVISRIKGQSDGYRELKTVVDGITGNKLLDWKYLAFTSPLVVRDAKNR